MSASRPGKEQHGGVLAGVKAKPCRWPTASPDTGCGHHPPAATRGSSKQLHHKIPTTEVSTDSGEALDGLRPPLTYEPLRALRAGERASQRPALRIRAAQTEGLGRAGIRPTERR